MPAMIRPSGKAKKVSRKLIGIPNSYQGKQAFPKMKREIFYQDTWRVK